MKKNQPAGVTRGRVIRLDFEPHALQALNDLVRALSTRENEPSSSERGGHTCGCGYAGPRLHACSRSEATGESCGWSESKGSSHGHADEAGRAKQRRPARRR